MPGGMHKRSALHQLFSQICEALSVHVTENSTFSAQVRRIFIPFTAMSTALVSAFYDVDDVLYQVSILFNDVMDSEKGKVESFPHYPTTCCSHIGKTS